MFLHADLTKKRDRSCFIAHRENERHSVATSDGQGTGRLQRRRDQARKPAEGEIFDFTSGTAQEKTGKQEEPSFTKIQHFGVRQFVKIKGTL